jgi:hypothetical protein
MAHVAFADDATLLRILRDIIRTLENAVGTSDALVVEVADDAGILFLFISSDWTTIEATGILTVVAGGRDGLLPCGSFISSQQQSGIPPGLTLIQSVQRMACGNAGLAPGAAVERNLEGILFSRSRFPQGNQLTVLRREVRPAVMDFRKSRHRCLQACLLGEQLVDQGLHDKLDADEDLIVFHADRIRPDAADIPAQAASVLQREGFLVEWAGNLRFTILAADHAP